MWIIDWFVFILLANLKIHNHSKHWEVDRMWLFPHSQMCEVCLFVVVVVVLHSQQPPLQPSWGCTARACCPPSATELKILHPKIAIILTDTRTTFTHFCFHLFHFLPFTFLLKLNVLSSEFMSSGNGCYQKSRENLVQIQLFFSKHLYNLFCITT